MSNNGPSSHGADVAKQTISFQQHRHQNIGSDVDRRTAQLMSIFHGPFSPARPPGGLEASYESGKEVDPTSQTADIVADSVEIGSHTLVSHQHAVPMRPSHVNNTTPIILVRGRDTYPSRATHDDICRNFLRGCCDWGVRCINIHPRPACARQHNLWYANVKLICEPTPNPRVEYASGVEPKIAGSEENWELDSDISHVPEFSGKRHDTPSPPPSQFSEDDDVRPDIPDWNYRVDPKAWLSRSSESESSSSSDEEGFSSLTSSRMSPGPDSGPDNPHFNSRPPTPDDREQNSRDQGAFQITDPMQGEVCRNWIRGICRRGLTCRYRHEQVSEHTLPFSSKICKNFLRGYCDRKTCWFAHPQAEQPPDKNTPAGPSRFPQATWMLPVHGDMKVKIGPGFEVQELVTGFETPWVFLDQLPSHIDSPTITRLLSEFGTVMDVRIPLNVEPFSLITVKARFENQSAASTAVTSLNGSQRFGTTIFARLPVNKIGRSVRLRDTAVRIAWEPPGLTGYAGYPTLERARAALAIVQQAALCGSYVHASPHKGLPSLGAYTIKFRHLPVKVTKADMKRYAEPDDFMWERPNYQSLQDCFEGFEGILSQFSGFTGLDKRPYPDKDGYMRAWAHFNSSSAAKEACNFLHLRRPSFTGFTRVQAYHVLSLFYRFTPEVYVTIEAEVEIFIRKTWERQLYSSVAVTHRLVPPVVDVRLSAEDIKELGFLKAEFERIQRGEILRGAGKVAWDDFFAHPAGHDFLRCLEREHPGLIVRSDVDRRTLTLLGSISQREVAKPLLLQKIVELQASQSHIAPLMGRVLGIFMHSEFKKLRDTLGADKVSLDLWNQRLIVRGTSEDYEVALRAIQDAQNQVFLFPSTNITECPVCFNKAVPPISLRCGHSYCRSCLQRYFITATENRLFPLKCVGNEACCKEPLPLTLARELLSAAEFDSLVHAAFTSYVDRHAKEFHYCPSPDCMQVYRSAPSGTVLQCPSCLIRICPECHVEYHDGFACRDKDGGETLFKEWVRTHGAKNCPGCNTIIERAEGCNHITCTQCQTHICWVCMQTFPGGDGIYAHMSVEHGGFGLGPLG